MYYLYIIIYTSVTIIYELIMDQHKGRTQNCHGHTLKICKTSFSLTPTVTQIASDNVFVFFLTHQQLFLWAKGFGVILVSTIQILNFCEHLQRAVVERDSLVVLIIRFLHLLSPANDEQLRLQTKIYKGTKEIDKTRFNSF